MSEKATEPHALAPHPVYYEMVMASIMEPILRRYGGVQHVGGEVLSEIDGSCIVAPVHRSMLDVPAVAQAAREATNTHIHFMAKDSLWKGMVLGKLIEFGGGFKVDRTKKQGLAAETAAHVGKLVSKGAALGIFPEGHRRTGDFIEEDDVKSAVRYVAVDYGIPIVPVGVSGTEKGHRHEPITLVFGEPIYVEKASASERIEAAKALKKPLAGALQDAQDEAILMGRH